MNFHTDYNKLPYDLELHWDGWRSSVGELMRSGWKIESIFNPEHMESVLIMKNGGLGLTGHGGMTVVEWHEAHHDPRNRGIVKYGEDRFRVRMFIGGNVTIRSEVRLSTNMTGAGMPVEVGKYYEPDHFSVIDMFGKNEPDEIIVEKRPDVISLLNQIKDLQEPRAKELLASERKRGKVESFETSANIIAIR